MPPADPIVSDNILAASAIYFSAMLEDLKAYEVADRLLALFTAGQLPIGTAGSGNVLYELLADRTGENYRAGTPQPLCQRARRSRRRSGSRAERGIQRPVVAIRCRRVWIRTRAGGGDVRSSATDLARNISQHSAGIHAAAVAVTDRIRDLLVVLSDPDIQRAFGVHGIWQLIDRVASLDLGGAHAVASRVAMAGSARVIFAWLAGQAPAFSLTDADDPLVPACERWLAASSIDRIDPD